MGQILGVTTDPNLIQMVEGLISIILLVSNRLIITRARNQGETIQKLVNDTQQKNEEIKHYQNEVELINRSYNQLLENYKIIQSVKTDIDVIHDLIESQKLTPPPAGV